MRQQILGALACASAVPTMAGLLQAIDFLGHALFGIHLGLGPL